jgi:glycerol-3-phosphate dehydrogenase subunit B
MKYDVCILGGGPAGLISGIRCAEEGLRTVIISGGMNSLHFSSGSIDLLGYDKKGKTVKRPFEAIPKLIEKKKDHPYARVGLPTVKKSLGYIQDTCREAGFELHSWKEENHFRFTAMGVRKPTYLSQRSVFRPELCELLDRGASIRVLEFEGYRDYFSGLTLENMKKDPYWEKHDISSGTINLPHYAETDRNLHEFRSIDLARIFDSDRFLPRIADDIRKKAGKADIVTLPAFISIREYQVIHRKLEEMTGLYIMELPGLPPSIPGLRLDESLRSRFMNLGGEFSLGDSVTGGEIADQEVQEIYTRLYGREGHSARFYVLATGSFFSNGLRSGPHSITEPVFDLVTTAPDDRSLWYRDRFFNRGGHPFLEYGVETDRKLHPLTGNGKTVTNLFAVGSILGGYNPVTEASGGGVALSTGYYAADQIIRSLKKGRKKKS